MITFNSVSDMKAARLTAGQLVATEAYYEGNLSGGATYLVQTSGEYGSTPDGYKDHTLANGNIAVLQLASTLYVEQFGAKGDGATNDSPSIQAAINACPIGGTVAFSGTSSSYDITSGISINKRITVDGSGAEITVSTAITVFTLSSPDAAIRGFNITGNRTSGQTGVEVQQNYIKVRDMNLSLLDQGIKVSGGVWQRIEHIRGRNIATKVLEVGNVVGTVVEDFRYDTDTGTYAEPTIGVDLYGEGCNFSDLDFIHAGTALQIRTNSRSSTWNFFNSCSFDTSTYGCRIINTDIGQSVKGIMFDQCWFSSHSEAGIYINGNFNTDGISIKGCHIVNNEKHGVIVDEASTNVEIIATTFAGNSVASPNTYPHIKHDSIGDVSVLTSHFHDWGGLTTIASAAIERTATAGYIVIGDCFSNSAHNTTGFADSSASGFELSVNFGNLPTDPTLTGGGGGGIPNSTTESTGNINLTSSDATFNTIRGRATVNSGVEGTTSSAVAYGGVFSNTGGGAGLRVDQGDAQFAGNASVDSNLSVSGSSTLTGAVAGAGFNSSVDARVTYEALNANADVGTGSTQVARGNHTHTKSAITDFQNYRMFGAAGTTNGSGLLTFAHGFGSAPAVVIVNMFGGSSLVASCTAVDSTNMTVEVRNTSDGSVKASSSVNVMCLVAEAP